MKKPLLVLTTILLVYCSKEDITMTTVKEYSFDETNSQLMFEDDLAQSTISSEDRCYEIGKL